MFYLTERIEAEIKDAEDGRITGAFRVARAGNVQDYLGSELGMPEKPIVRVYRPEAVVFSKDAMATFAHRVVTVHHPDGLADFDRDAVGWLGAEVARDGEFIRVPMSIVSKKGIKAVRQDGMREFSAGYGSELDFTPGVSPKGEAYDAVMTKYVVDHVAIVPAARGGSELRIGDWRGPGSADPSRTPSTGDLEMEVKTVTVLVDGLSVVTTEQGQQAIAKLQKDVADGKAREAQLVTDHKAAIAAKDTTLAQRDAEIDGLKAKVLTDAQMDARVKARGDLVAVAKAIVDADYSGKSEIDIRRAVVHAKLGDAAVKDKSDAYIEARFDVLVDEAKKDPVRGALLVDGQFRNQNPQDNGQSAYEKRLADAWKGNSHQQKGA